MRRLVRPIISQFLFLAVCGCCESRIVSKILTWGRLRSETDAERKIFAVNPDTGIHGSEGDDAPVMKAPAAVKIPRELALIAHQLPLESTIVSRILRSAMPAVKCRMVVPMNPRPVHASLMIRESRRCSQQGQPANGDDCQNHASLHCAPPQVWVAIGLCLTCARELT
jgi:hypothetical protein